MKQQTTLKALKARYDCINVPYTLGDVIAHAIEPAYYNAGVYGWNYDAVIVGGTAICYGYRVPNMKRVEHDNAKAIEQKVREVINAPRYTWQYKRDKVEQLIYAEIINKRY